MFALTNLASIYTRVVILQFNHFLGIDPLVTTKPINSPKSCITTFYVLHAFLKKAAPIVITLRHHQGP